MIDEDGNRKASPAPPAIPPHMRDGLRSAAQRKVFGEVEEEGAPPRAAKKTSARKATKRAAKKSAEEPVWPEK